MGQDTYCDLGYGVSIEIKPENIDLILKAWQSDEISTYFSDYDEALLTENYTQEEFENELKNRIKQIFSEGVLVEAKADISNILGKKKVLKGLGRKGVKKSKIKSKRKNKGRKIKSRIEQSGSSTVS